MLKLFRSKTFLRDYRKLQISDQCYAKYLEFLSILIKSEKLPKEARDHSLRGNYKNYREFHISGDLLIIYTIEDGYLKLIRIGTHSQLFK
ncbi:MAG: type II toxin-antitoxin system mRNA interferase toxin, RelE/StbE family [Proteobacteria bacterium]|nr:MAG: type II toxin-antitoxin system mRNA interferase toxin, RelE/StbE family [Pseudomonadota bacterium]